MSVLILITTLAREAFSLRTQDIPPESITRICHENFANPIPQLQTREEFAHFSSQHQLHSIAELGVQKGLFAKHILRGNPGISTYHLVDLWAHQENYVDRANVNDKEHLNRMQITRKILEKYANKTIYHKMLTSEAAQKIKNNSLDFLYVDARHDYCGTKQDLELYWPKMKACSVMAGHDFYDSAQVTKLTQGVLILFVLVLLVSALMFVLLYGVETRLEQMHGWLDYSWCCEGCCNGILRNVSYPPTCSRV